MFVWLSVPANTTVFAEGDYGMAFYIVVTGECVVTAKSPHNDDEEIKLNELHANGLHRAGPAAAGPASRGKHDGGRRGLPSPLSCACASFSF